MIDWELILGNSLEMIFKALLMHDQLFCVLNEAF